nr:PHD finger protein ALFIN-LIKE 4 [Tanacetum cinerariifolium]
MEGGRTEEAVFTDFKGRRTGIIKALTTDFEDFFQQCDPEKDNLCLYRFPSEQWEVNLPAKLVPPELPEPALRINFVRDEMQRKEWLALVADYSDLWLLSLAFYFGARFSFDKAQRSKCLFNMINDLPDIFDVVKFGKVEEEVEEEEEEYDGDASCGFSGEYYDSDQRGSEPQAVKYGKVEEEVEEEEEEYDGDASCGFSGEYYDLDQCGSEPQAVKYGKVEEEVEEEKQEYDGNASCRFSREYYDSDQRGSEP